MSFKNYYKILNYDINLYDEEIKKNYRQLASKYHHKRSIWSPIGDKKRKKVYYKTYNKENIKRALSKHMDSNVASTQKLFEDLLLFIIIATFFTWLYNYKG